MTSIGRSASPGVATGPDCPLGARASRHLGLRHVGAVGFEHLEGVAVEGRGPAGEVDDVVVVVAERDDVDERGDAAVLPVDDVMALGPTMRSAATRISTSPVADLSGPVDLGWDRAAGAADVEGEAVRAGDD